MTGLCRSRGSVFQENSSVVACVERKIFIRSLVIHALRVVVVMRPFLPECNYIFIACKIKASSLDDE